MSTTAEPQDPERMQQALANIRSDTDGVQKKAWVLAGHVDNNPNIIDIVQQDTSEGACIEDIQEHLQDDQVMYGLVRLTTTFDMSTTVKFVYIHWVGNKVPFAKKGRYGVVHGSVEQCFHPFHHFVETSSREDITEEELLTKLEESAGTRSHVVEGSIAGRQVRGFTANEYKRQVKTELRSVAPKGATIEVSPELNEAIGDVRQDGNPATWVLATYEENNLKKPLVVVGTGSGDIEEMRDALVDDQVMYGLYRTTDAIDNIETVKFVYIYWVGESVKPLMKGKVSACAGPVEKIFSPAHVTISFTNRYDIDENTIRDKVSSTSGSMSHVRVK